ncbi:hypothetical protein DRP05_00225 [Archaeoglobales archaeon]|nr:MAG: hypothetical protein DRP05_00225 [Archaeoglobales archaeon]
MIYEAFSSQRRVRTLRQLQLSPANFSKLQQKTGLNHTSLLIHLRKLLSCGLIEKEGKVYKLSQTGKLIYGTLDKLDRFIIAFERGIDFWIEHDLSTSPEELLLRLGDLGHYEIVSCKNENPMCFVERIGKILSKSRWVRIVSSISLHIYHFCLPR